MEAEIAEQQATVEARLRQSRHARSDGRPSEETDDGTLIRDVIALDSRRQEISHLRSAQIFYQLLSDFAGGAREFLVLLGQARREHNVLFEDLLAFQMERVLPDGPDPSPLGDVVVSAVARFQDWLQGEGSDRYADIGLALAAFLIDREQLDAALALLDRLPVAATDHVRRCRLSNLRGNARMRMPGQVQRAAADFRAALAEAAVSRSDDQLKLLAEGYKELGFYYRNIGLWDDADRAYREARDAISVTLSVDSPDSDREEMASIQTNWAYLKGIGGHYPDGISLAESAISIRRRIGRQHEVAISLSVSGEVYRYQRSFGKAWLAYAEVAELHRSMERRRGLVNLASGAARRAVLATPSEPWGSCRSRRTAMNPRRTSIRAAEPVGCPPGRAANIPISAGFNADPRSRPPALARLDRDDQHINTSYGYLPQAPGEMSRTPKQNEP